MNGAQGAREGWILPCRVQQVFRYPLLQAGSLPDSPFTPAPVGELPSLQERTAFAALCLMPRRLLCPQLTLLQVWPPGDLFLLSKTEPRLIKDNAADL